METKHTPGPWQAEIVGTTSAGPDAENVCELTNGHKRIAEFVLEDDALFIVRACNAHEQLVAALKEAQRCLAKIVRETSQYDGMEVHEAQSSIKYALKAAGAT